MYIDVLHIRAKNTHEKIMRLRIKKAFTVISKIDFLKKIMRLK